MLLPELSRQAGISPFYLQRLFTKVVGVSPRRYVQACRIEALKTNLREGSTVTDAIYESGFGSSSRVYERVDSELGMTPSSYRSGGKGLEISYAVIDCSLGKSGLGESRLKESALGKLMIAATDRGLCSVQLGDSKELLLERLNSEYPKAQLQPLNEPYSELFRYSINALSLYLNKQNLSPQLSIDVRATAFQLKVWTYLQAIPAGEVRTYSEVAEAIGQPNAIRAVARACASNQIALVIPCHRVIRSDGKLGGYRWGLERKKLLLQHEQAFAPVP